MLPIKLINKYIIQSVFSSTIMVLIVLTMIELLFAYLGQLNTTTNQYDVIKAFLYTLMTTPSKVYLMIPYSALIGAILGLGQLANHSELTVMRSAGISIWKIAQASLIPALFLIGIGLILSEFIAPQLNQFANHQRQILRSGNQNIPKINYGKFWHADNKTYAYIQTSSSSNVINGLTLFNFNDQYQLKNIITAQKAIYQDHQIWKLIQVKQIDFNKGDKTLAPTIKEYSTWKTNLNEKIIRFQAIHPEDLTLSNLFYYTKYDRIAKNNLYQLELWKRILQPLSIIALILIGIAFTFTNLRHSTIGFRIFIGITIGLTFMLIQNLFGSISLLFNIPAPLAASLPILAIGSLGILLIKKAA